MISKLKYQLKKILPLNNTGEKIFESFLEEPFEKIIIIPNFTRLWSRAIIGSLLSFFASLIAFLVVGYLNRDVKPWEIMWLFPMITTFIFCVYWLVIHLFYNWKKKNKKWKAITSIGVNLLILVSIVAAYCYYLLSRYTQLSPSSFHWFGIIFIAGVFGILMIVMYLRVDINFDIKEEVKEIENLRYPPNIIRKRIALVIGNSNYKHYKSLQEQPINEAMAIKKCFEKKLNVEKVILGIDVDTTKLGDLFFEFKREAEQGGYTEIFFFYSGHGGESQTKNYLVPVEAPIPKDIWELKIALYPFKTFLELFARLPQATHLHVFIDACRDNPEKIATQQQELAIEERREQTLPNKKSKGKKSVATGRISKLISHESDDHLLETLRNKGKKSFLLFSSAKY